MTIWLANRAYNVLWEPKILLYVYKLNGLCICIISNLTFLFIQTIANKSNWPIYIPQIFKLSCIIVNMIIYARITFKRIIHNHSNALIKNSTYHVFLFFLSRQVRLFYMSRLSCCSLLCLWSCWWIDINLWTASSQDVRIRKEAKTVRLEAVIKLQIVVVLFILVFLQSL